MLSFVVQRALRLALAGDEQDTSIPVKVGSQSPVAHFAMEVIRDIAGQTLAATLDGCHDGVTPHWWAEEAARIMEVWSDEVDVRNVTPTPDAVEWCHNMRALGARLAICTSDNRPNTLATLETAGFDLDLFQVLLCGGDEGYLAKVRTDTRAADMACCAVHGVAWRCMAPWRTARAGVCA